MTNTAAPLKIETALNCFRVGTFISIKIGMIELEFEKAKNKVDKAPILVTSSRAKMRVGLGGSDNSIPDKAITPMTIRTTSATERSEKDSSKLSERRSDSGMTPTRVTAKIATNRLVASRLVSEIKANATGNVKSAIMIMYAQSEPNDDMINIISKIMEPGSLKVRKARTLRDLASVTLAARSMSELAVSCSTSTIRAIKGARAIPRRLKTTPNPRTPAPAEEKKC